MLSTQALIEHVGDVSSLEGKVQRIHDEARMKVRDMEVWGMYRGCTGFRVLGVSC